MAGPARDSTAESLDTTSAARPAAEALEMMIEALRLIDLCDGAGVPGAHLDLAIHRLREWIETADAK